MMADKACSLLAALLYWQESSAALGPDRAARILRK
jgi:hypothetical protein